jgi:hypothetical protein
MRSGMNVIELGCFFICSFAALLIGGPLGHRFGVVGWIVGVPLGFFGCFGLVSALFWLGGLVENRFRRRRAEAPSNRSDEGHSTHSE